MTQFHEPVEDEGGAQMKESESFSEGDNLDADDFEVIRHRMKSIMRTQNAQPFEEIAEKEPVIEKHGHEILKNLIQKYLLTYEEEKDEESED